MEGWQVRLVGDPQVNIQLLLRTLPHEQDDRPLLASVFTILYAKIDRLRQERNHYRHQLTACKAEQERAREQAQQERATWEQERGAWKQERATWEQERGAWEEERGIWEQERGLLAAEMGKWRAESERVQRELEGESELRQHELSPVPLSNYRSCQLLEKENLASGRGHSVSVFGEGERAEGQLVGEVMRKYKLSAGEFKEILVRHIEEEGRLLEKLETESQRRLFQQSKKIKNYDEWMRKVKKQCHRTHSPLRPRNI